MVLLQVQGDFGAWWELHLCIPQLYGVVIWVSPAAGSPSCSGYYHLTSVSCRTRGQALVSIVFGTFSVKQRNGHAWVGIRCDRMMFQYLLMLLNSRNSKNQDFFLMKGFLLKHTCRNLLWKKLSLGFCLLLLSVQLYSHNKPGFCFSIEFNCNYVPVGILLKIHLDYTLKQRKEQSKLILSSFHSNFGLLFILGFFCCQFFHCFWQSLE